jgi:hypothetical protein
LAGGFLLRRGFFGRLGGGLGCFLGHNEVWLAVFN